jgi:hypothetical protein
MGSILNQILGSIQRFPKCLKGVRIIGFAFFLDGSVPEAANRRTQTLDRVDPNPEGSCQSMFQDLSFRVECLLSRWRDGNVSSLGKNQAKSLENFPGAQPALLWLPTLLDCQRVICAVVFDLEAQKLMDGDQCLRVFGDDQYLSALGRILGSVDDLIL